jgi:putative flippase GtrA
MNRGFLIIIGPALLVTLIYLAMGWGAKAASAFGVAVLVIAAAVVLARWAFLKKPQNNGRPEASGAARPYDGPQPGGTE